MKIFLHLVLAAAITASKPDPIDADVAWIAAGGFCEPETVLALPDNTLLVSNVCGFKQRGNGFLSLLDSQGQALDWRILENLDAPLGMVLLEGQLFLIDNNRLKVYAWPGYELLRTVELETAVANDLAVSDDGVVYVTDTARHQVIRLLPDGTQSVLTGQPNFRGANGIALYNGKLYVGGERLWRVDLSDDTIETIGAEWIADIDGIEFEPDGTLQVTPVAGPLIRFKNEFEVQVFAGSGISSANHGYAANLRLALIPTGFDNTVIAIRIPQRKGSL